MLASEIFAAGVALGDVAVSFFVAGAALGDVGVSFFVASAALVKYGSRAGARNVVIFTRKCISERSCSDPPRIMDHGRIIRQCK